MISNIVPLKPLYHHFIGGYPERAVPGTVAQSAGASGDEPTNTLGQVPIRHSSAASTPTTARQHPPERSLPGGKDWCDLRDPQGRWEQLAGQAHIIRVTEEVDVAAKYLRDESIRQATTQGCRLNGNCLPTDEYHAALPNDLLQT